MSVFLQQSFKRIKSVLQSRAIFPRLRVKNIGSGSPQKISASTGSSSKKQINRFWYKRIVSFLIAKKGVRADPKYWLPPAPDQILNRLRLQLKNLGSDRLWLRKTAITVVLLHKKFVSIEAFHHPSILQTDRSKYLFKRLFRLHRLRNNGILWLVDWFLCVLYRHQPSCYFIVVVIKFSFI